MNDKAKLLRKLQKISDYMYGRLNVLDKEVKNKEYCTDKAYMRGKRDGITECVGKLDQLISEV